MEATRYFYLQRYYFRIVFTSPYNVINIVTNSAAGKASQTPVRPKSADRTNANRIIATNPREMDAAKAYFADSTELKMAVPTMFIPANRNPIKYNLKPFSA